MHIFVDISANPQKECAVGCYLIILDLDIELTEIKNSLQTINLAETTSTAAELELIDIVLTNTQPQENPINLYTDCNNFYNLFIKKSYCTNHHSAELYAKLLVHIERLNINVIKIKGHAKRDLQISIEQQIFSILDKFARKTLRKQICELNY